MSQERDRLGLLGVGDHDSEVSGSLSGLQRLNTARYNKVSTQHDSHENARLMSAEYERHHTIAGREFIDYYFYIECDVA